MQKPRAESGFTLLEVMIALLIFSIGIGAIISAESNSLDVTFRARRMSTVATLARNTIINAEQELAGKTFDEVKESSNGQFEAPYTDYSWERKIKEVTFPNITGQGAGGGAAGAEGGAGATGGSASSGSTEVPGVERVVKIATNYLSKSTRELVVTIKWKEKNEDQSYSVSQYWVDLNHEFNFSETP